MKDVWSRLSVVSDFEIRRLNKLMGKLGSALANPARK